jgi:hypothetical protein
MLRACLLACLPDVEPLVWQSEPTSLTLLNPLRSCACSQNPAEEMQQWKSQHVMAADLGHIDRVDGSIYAPEMNDLEIDVHRGQDPVTHQKIEKKPAPSAKAKTRGALLTGLRNGELEKAVDKMEADQAETERKAAVKAGAVKKTKGALITGLRNGELEKAVEKMEQDTAAEEASNGPKNGFNPRQSGMHADGSFTNPIGAD